MKKSIGTLLLTGLMIGPILGSGIILLPPLAYNTVGALSLFAWVIIMTLGAMFAFCFMELTIKHPGEGGMTNAVESQLGGKWKLFSSFALISAVLAGPAAVILTAVEYLEKLSFLSGIPTLMISIIMILLTWLLLMKDVKSISRISFITSSIITVILIISSISAVLNHELIIYSGESFEFIEFGRVLLLLFWAIIGWEVIGNYSEDVKDLNKTMKRATIISVIVITTTYILVALAFNSINQADIDFLAIIRPVFGMQGELVLTILITSLCVTTYLLIVGAVGRLIRNLAAEGYLPSIMNMSNKHQVPVLAITCLAGAHILVLTLLSLKLLTIHDVVNWANGFFAVNAIVGLVASFKMSRNMVFKISSIALILGIGGLLFFMSFKTMIAIILIYGLSRHLNKKEPIDLQVAVNE